MRKPKAYKWKRGEGEVGSLAFVCHHETIVEVLTEPAKNRVAYIKSGKPENERPVRLAAFQPFNVPMPKSIRAALGNHQRAYAEWSKADAEWSKAYAEWSKADAEWSKADAERSKADAEWSKADAEWSKAYAELKKQIALHEDRLIAAFNKKDPLVQFKKGHGLVFPGETI